MICIDGTVSQCLMQCCQVQQTRHVATSQVTKGKEIAAPTAVLKQSQAHLHVEQQPLQHTPAPEPKDRKELTMHHESKRRDALSKPSPSPVEQDLQQLLQDSPAVQSNASSAAPADGLPAVGANPKQPELQQCCDDGSQPKTKRQRMDAAGQHSHAEKLHLLDGQQQFAVEEQPLVDGQQSPERLQFQADQVRITSDQAMYRSTLQCNISDVNTACSAVT